MTTIIDYGAGNIKSVEKAFAFIGEEVICTKDENIIRSSDRILLPGTGSFGYAMDSLKKTGLIPVIKDLIAGGTPFMGICLGFQMLFDGSEENAGVEGLSILPGDVVRFPETDGFTIPQIGWNSLDIKKDTILYDGIPTETFVYFVHSYYVRSKNRDVVATQTDYILDYDSSVESGHIFGCQFHPEKSSHAGINMLRNFVKCTRSE